MKAQTESDTVNRRQLAKHFKVSLQTTDDWVRRGCPVISNGAKGVESRFSLGDVEAWRAHDIRRRTPATALNGVKTASPLRMLVQEPQRYFLANGFERCTKGFFNSCKKRGVDEETSILLALDFYGLFARHYETSIMEDHFEEHLRERGDTLDISKRCASGPPRQCSIQDEDLPEPLQEACNRLMELRSK